MGRGAGALSPRALLQAKAHALGGSPLAAMPHALAAMALSDKATLLGLHTATALELAAIQLNTDPSRALSLLHCMRAEVMRNGSPYELAQLQLLSASCRLAMLPGYAQHKPPKIEQVQPHILPALSAALASFGKLRCHAEVAGLLYMRARIWHSVGSHELRDRDARAFVLSEQYAAEAASRTCGSLLDFAETGVLEMHIERLKVLQTEAIAMYVPSG